MSEITCILSAMKQGDPHATEQLLWVRQAPLSPARWGRPLARHVGVRSVPHSVISTLKPSARCSLI
jgi:hypothetical protein